MIVVYTSVFLLCHQQRTMLKTRFLYTRVPFTLPLLDALIKIKHVNCLVYFAFKAARL